MIHTHLSACPKTPEVDSNVTLGALSARGKTPKLDIKPRVQIYDPHASLGALIAHSKTLEVDTNVALGALSACSKTPKLEIKSWTFQYIKPRVQIYDPHTSLGALSACPKTPEVDLNVTLGALSARPKTPKLVIKWYSDDFV